MVTAELGADYPTEYEFINRGIGGNRSVDLYARIKADFINLKPDYASIYIGVNDVWAEIDHKNGIDTEKFEKIYTMLIDEVQAACPGIKLMLIAPFVLEGIILGAFSGGVSYFIMKWLSGYVVESVVTGLDMLTVLPFEAYSSVILWGSLGIGVVCGVIGSTISIGRPLEA